MIAFDEPLTFPADIRKWVIDRKDYFLQDVSINYHKNNIKIALEDIYFYDIMGFEELLYKYEDDYFVGWHITRIEDIERYCGEGILTLNGKIDVGVKKLEYYLLERMHVDINTYNQIVEKAKYYWKRDNGRISRVYFYFTRAQTLNNARAIKYAENLGGEILNWSLRAVDKDLYKKEPYHSLWVWGIPCRVKFRAHLKEFDKRTQYDIIKQISIYYAMKEIYGVDYHIEYAGSKQGSVSPDDLLQIEVIDDFTKVVSKKCVFNEFDLEKD